MHLNLSMNTSLNPNMNRPLRFSCRLSARRYATFCALAGVDPTDTVAAVSA